MKKKDIEIFNKAIHEVKGIIRELSEERDLYHKAVGNLTIYHDKKIDNMLKETKSVLDEMYILFDDLYNNGDG